MKGSALRKKKTMKTICVDCVSVYFTMKSHHLPAASQTSAIYTCFALFLIQYVFMESIYRLFVWKPNQKCYREDHDPTWSSHRAEGKWIWVCSVTDWENTYKLYVHCLEFHYWERGKYKCKKHNVWLHLCQVGCIVTKVCSRPFNECHEPADSCNHSVSHWIQNTSRMHCSYTDFWQMTVSL